MKHGVLATVWLIVRGPDGVELQAFPELRSHEIYDCSGIQNAVDAYLDHLVSKITNVQSNRNRAGIPFLEISFAM